jgi:hypothetical protein
MCALSILFLQNLKSQNNSNTVNSEDTAQKSTIYKATVFQNFQQISKGYLVTINDSSLFLSKAKLPLSFEKVNLAYLGKFDYRSIEKVKLFNPKTKTTAIIVSVVAGIIVGAIIGYSNGTDTDIFGTTAAEKAVVGGLAGGGAGAIVGAIIGKVSEKTYLIDGEWKSLAQMKESLQNKK